MRTPVHRRALLATAPAAGLAFLGLGAAARAQPPASKSPAPAAWPNFPHQDPGLVRGIVGAAHRDEARVRELIDAHPALVNAAWDWGFGDWETPLDAAAHTGRRNIAELLISRGARVDLFAAAMLGWIDTVKAATSSSPGVQRALGPHGLTLLHHARAGGPAAEQVVSHLQALGDADTRTPSSPLAEGTGAQYEGTFVYGAAPGERFTVRSAKQGMEFVHGEKGPIRLTMVADGEFFPAGAPAVRFRFSVRDGSAQRAVITDHDLVVTGVRTG
ncbi:MAG TPA: hypothetical protein VEB22_05305 [Phycisphaerales bacterium]|nr:hypothetical protein [Phycisphaerales bacterium]